MAEFIFKDMVQKAGLSSDFQIASAATSSEEIGNPVYPPARKKLAEHCISCNGKTARILTSTDYQKYDLLIGMDDANCRNMMRLFANDPDGKIHLLLDFSGEKRDVADPWYTGDFETTWQDILRGCTALLTHLRASMNK